VNRNNKELQKLIDKHGALGKKVNNKWWYQPIKFKDNVMTHSHKYSDKIFYSRKSFGINKWNNYIKPFLPFNLKDKVILDIGSNSGLFIIQSLKEGAKFVYGIESDHKSMGRIEQHNLVVDIFSEIDNFDYKSRIKIIQKQAHKVDWKNDFNHYIDIVIAANVIYWFTFSDEYGIMTNAVNILEDILENISKISSHILIIGDENVQGSRKSKNEGYLCTGIETTLPFLGKYNVMKSWIDKKDNDRKASVILAESI